MAHSLDYTIDAKQIKIKQNPKEIRVKVTCGEVECSTTVYQMQKYSRTWMLAQLKNSPLFYTVENANTTTILWWNSVLMWKKHISRKHFAQSFLLTIFENTTLFLVRFLLTHNKQIHGLLYSMKTLNALQVLFSYVYGAPILMVCSFSVQSFTASGIKESARKTATKDYFPTYHTTRALSSEVCPFNTALGHKSSSCMWMCFLNKQSNEYNQHLLLLCILQSSPSSHFGFLQIRTNLWTPLILCNYANTLFAYTIDRIAELILWTATINPSSRSYRSHTRMIRHH